MPFPFYKQLESSDCGAACLRMIAKYHGKHFTSETIRAKTYVSREGTSFLGLKQAAECLGMEAYALKLDREPYANLSNLRASCTGTRTTLWWFTK